MCFQFPYMEILHYILVTLYFSNNSIPASPTTRTMLSINALPEFNPLYPCQQFLTNKCFFLGQKENYVS